MRNWLKTTVALAAVATAAAATLTACSSSGADDGKTKLSFMMWGDGGDTDKAYKQVIKDFEKKNPDVTITAEFFNTDDYDSILKTRLSGGAGPDIYGFTLGNNYITDGFAADLRDGGKKYLSKLSDDALKTAKQWYPKGKKGGVYNVPITLAGNGVLYNKKLFEKAGITTAPTTYSELLADCKKLADAGVIPFAMSAKDNWWPQFIIYYALAQHGADEKLADKMAAGKADFAHSKAWAESFDIVKQLVPYYMPNPLGTSQTAAQSAFLQGKAAMFPATWGLSDARKAGIDVGYMNFPTTNKPANAMWGTYQARFAINPNNGKVDAAQKFLNYFFSDDVYRSYLEKVKLFPTTTTVKVGAEVDPLFPVMQKAWEGKKFIALFCPADKVVQDKLLATLQNVIAGKSTTKQALAAMDTALAQVQARSK